jgi:hypothetical protein
MPGYTFRMKGMFWLLLAGSVVAAAWGWWRMRRRIEDQQRDEAVRAATFVAQAMPGKRPVVATAGPDALPTQGEQLLLDAAFKAGQAGEPALAIQLYARLISRFPRSALVAQARAGAEAQKKKLSIPKAPGPSAPG